MIVFMPFKQVAAALSEAFAAWPSVTLSPCMARFLAGAVPIEDVFNSRLILPCSTLKTNYFTPRLH